MNKEDNARNLQDISLEQIREAIKKTDPVFYDKMIFNPSDAIKRTNFLFVNYSSEVLNRTAKVLEFPLYGAVRDNFEEFKGGVSVHGNKKEVVSTHLFKTLSNNYNIEPVDDFNSLIEDLEHPITETGGQVSSSQPYYFLPERTTSWTCDTCNGGKYVVCDDYECGGRHEWNCVDCNAKGILTCHNCAGQGRVDCSRCHGSNKVKCSNCGGDGKVNDGGMAKIARSAQDGRQKDKFFQEKTCGKCSGRGKVNCSSCSNGKVVCSTCTGSGKVTCKTCKGNRTIVCTKCYADKERYGKIDCPQCKAMGEMAKISFVDTTVDEKSVSRIFFGANNIADLDPQSLLKFANKSAPQEVILKNYNNTNEKNYDALFEEYVDQIQRELNLSIGGFKHRVTREELFCQIIPCVQIEFKHILTSKTHHVTLLNFFGNCEVIIDKSSEQIKTDSKVVASNVSNFFAGLFKTKKFKEKEDKKREVKLMIMLAKIDGKIEDEEKMFLANEIASLDTFTKSEKMELFNLMDAKELPELTKKDVIFYDLNVYNATIEKLKTLSSQDNQVEQSELDFISKIEAKHQEFSKKK